MIIIIIYHTIQTFNTDFSETRMIFSYRCQYQFWIQNGRIVEGEHTGCPTS